MSNPHISAPDFLADKIGFVSKADLIEFKAVQKKADVIAAYLRMLDQGIGGMALLQMAVTDRSTDNDMSREAFKFSIKQTDNIIKEMFSALDEVSRSTAEKVKEAAEKTA